MACSLRRGVGVTVSGFPTFLGLIADSLAIMLTAAAVLAPMANTVAEELPNNVVLDFTAVWCGPCQQMSPIVRKLEQQGYAIHPVDVDRNRGLAERFKIQTIPTFVLVVDGKEVTRVNGLVTEDQLRRMAMQAGTAQRAKPNMTPNPPPAAVPLIKESRVLSNESGTENTQATLGQPENAPDLSLPPNGKSAKSPMGLSKSNFSLFSRFKKTSPASKEESPVVRGQARDAELSGISQAGNYPLAATTRLRINDGKGTNFGSGTIIDSRVGLTTILTCGHIFRQQPTKSKVAAPPTVEVDVFQANGRPETYVGKLVDFDLDADVGIVTIATTGALPMIPIAPLNEVPVVEDAMMSIGCSGGENPTAEAVQVTAVNRYDGPDNIECTGLPVQGRSGGGLFDAHGQLAGVCVAADPQDRRGLYASLKPIHNILTRAGLQQLLASDENDAVAAVEQETVDADHEAAEEESTDKPFRKEDSDRVPAATTSRTELAALFQDAPDAEVICIVRPKNGTEKQVVVLNQASARFISYLLESVESSPAKSPRMASSDADESAMQRADDAAAAENLPSLPRKAQGLGGERQRSALAREESPMARRNRFGSRD